MIQKWMGAIVCLLMASGSHAFAVATLSVDIGWGGHTRPHRWVPVMVTASDTVTQNVVLEVYWPHGGNYSMRVRQVFAIGPTPATFPLVLPSHSYFNFQEAVFTLREPRSGRTLARFPDPPGNWQGVAPVAGNDAALVGVSGQRSFLESLRGNLSNQQLAIDYLVPALLPATPLAFDSLDLLVLNQANLSITGGGERGLDATQQQAVLDWVRAGGNLIAWPSATTPFPASSPLVDVFPCRMGGRKALDLTADDLNTLGLTKRFAKTTAFDCLPEAGAEPVKILGGHATAYARRLGLGRIVVSPLSIADLQFDDTEKSRAAWTPLVAGMHVLPQPMANTPSPAPAYSNGLSRDDQKETAAAMSIADRLGNVPGAGEFGFAYVVVVMVGMMIIVGPVDWWVLKKLGRQPWTWVTTSGWILLITLAAVSTGYLLKSGDLHYRTLRLVDQVADAGVASIDCVGIYSPRTRQYELAADPESWWQPSGVEDYGRGSAPIELDFHQTYQGNTPEAMGINVWSLRFLRADQVGLSPPMIATSLSRLGGSYQIVGVIKNLTDRPLRNLHVQSGNSSGIFVLRAQSPATLPASAPATQSDDGSIVTEIAPFATVRVEAVLKPDAPPPAVRNAEPLYYYGQTVQLSEQQSIDQLDMRRSTRIAELLHSDRGLACVYAESVNPPAPIRLANQAPIEQHFQYLRALVELKARGDQ